jgi:hypothetical protein
MVCRRSKGFLTLAPAQRHDGLQVRMELRLLQDDGRLRHHRRGPVGPREPGSNLRLQADSHLARSAPPEPEVFRPVVELSQRDIRLSKLFERESKQAFEIPLKLCTPN